jgi:flagellar biosynthesis/type III secretory pathway protein FliH
MVHAAPPHAPHPAAAWAPQELHTPHVLGANGDGPEHDAGAATRSAHEAAELERMVAEAYARGLEDGRRQGELAERTRLRTAVQTAEQALDELRANAAQTVGMVEENICALAVAVARHVIGRELEGDAEALADLVRRALAEFPIDQPIRIRVNPLDLTTMTAFASGDGGVSPIASGRDVRWLADARVAPGGCVVEGRDRIVDGRVDTALERVYRRLINLHA